MMRNHKREMFAVSLLLQIALDHFGGRLQVRAMDLDFFERLRRHFAWPLLPDLFARYFNQHHQVRFDNDPNAICFDMALIGAFDELRDEEFAREFNESERYVLSRYSKLDAFRFAIDLTNQDSDSKDDSKDDSKTDSDDDADSDSRSDSKDESKDDSKVDGNEPVKREALSQNRLSINDEEFDGMLADMLIAQRRDVKDEQHSDNDVHIPDLPELEDGDDEMEDLV